MAHGSPVLVSDLGCFHISSPGGEVSRSSFSIIAPPFGGGVTTKLDGLLEPAELTAIGR